MSKQSASNESSSDDQRLSRSRRIEAPASVIFDLLADPTRHPDFDGSGTVNAVRGGTSTRLSLGDKFGMKMKLGVPYLISNKVVEFEEDRLIAWAHFGKHRWRYELETDGDATIVTETFDWSTAKSPWFIEQMGWPTRHIASIEQTLERLDKIATGLEAS